uniref:HNH endonuclease n=1 Tax=Globodera pallida TaxID=36090 RepID=A0A183C1Y0_GLOPA
MATSSTSSDKGDYEFHWNNPKEIKKKWESFAKFGHSQAQAAQITEITGKNFDKWLKDAGVIDNKTITTTMTGIAFSKVAGPKKKANFNETKQVIVNVAKDRASSSKRDIQVNLKMLTDHTKYTGAHKERFNSEGKGKGKSGRVDIVENTGYVSSYRNAGTYDQVHKK